MLYLEAFTCQNRYQRTLLVSDLLSLLVMCRLNNNLHSASLQLTPNWGEQSSCFRAGLSLRGTWTAGGMGHLMKSSNWDGIAPCNSSAEKVLRMLMSNKLHEPAVCFGSKENQEPEADWAVSAEHSPCTDRSGYCDYPPLCSIQ